MKKIITTALGLLAATSFLSYPAQAGTVANGFTVQVNLIPSCAINSNTNILDFGAYQSFTSAQFPTPSVAISFKCTQGFAPTNVAFDTTLANLTTSTASAPQPTGTGVIAGLLYTLSTDAVTTTAGSLASSAAGSGPDIKTFTVRGTMAPLQAGVFPSGIVAQPRMLTLSF